LGLYLLNEVDFIGGQLRKRVAREQLLRYFAFYECKKLEKPDGCAVLLSFLEQADDNLEFVGR
jgi:hypothetical protein